MLGNTTRAGVLSMSRIGLCVLTLLIVCTAADAQGTSGMLPDPVSSRDLETYFAWLRLDDEQKRSVEAAHDRYRAEFRRLREGDIQKLLDEINNLQRSAMMVPDRESVEGVLDRQRRLLSRIASIDNRFFDDLVPLLGDEQIIMLERAKMHRERLRYDTVTQALDFGSGRVIDLAEMLRELPMPTAALEPVDPIIEDYERGLTRRKRDLFELTASMAMSMFDAMESAGMLNFEEVDPEDAMAMMERMEAIMAEASRPALEKQIEIRKLHSRAFRQVVDLLPPTEADALRDRFYRQMHPEVFRGYWPAAQLFADVLARREMKSEDRLMIETLFDEYERNVARQIEQIVRKAERDPQLPSGPFSFGSDDPTEYDKELDKYRKQRDRMNQEAITALSAILGDDSIMELLERSGDDRRHRIRAVAVNVGGGHIEAEVIEGDANVEVSAPMRRPGNAIDPLAPIGLGEMLEYARRAGITDAQRPVVELLHESYVEDFTESAAKGPLAEAASSRGAPWAFDPNTGRSRKLSPEEIERRHRARKKAFDEVTRLDHRFFEDVELSALEPAQVIQWDRMRRLRELRRLTATDPGGMFAFSMNAIHEHEVELLTLVLDLELDQRMAEAVMPMVDAYMREALDLNRRRRDAQQRATIEQEKFSVAMMSDEGNMTMSFDGDVMVRMQEIARPLNDLNQSLQDLNREYMKRITALLEPGDADRLRDAYYRRAFPEVYADPQQLHDFFTSALQHDAIEADTRAALQSLQAEYDQAYTGVIEALIELHKDARPASAMGWDPAAFSEQMERRNTIEKVNFDRREVNLKIARRLKELLTEDQIRRCGGLPRGFE